MDLTNLSFYNSSYIEQEQNIYSDIELINEFCDGYPNYILFKFYFMLAIQLILFIISFIFRFINEDKFKYKVNVLNIVEYINNKLIFFYTLIALMLVIPNFINLVNIDDKLIINLALYFNLVIFSIIGYLYYKKGIFKNIFSRK